jgi:hypothetical protein
MRRALLLLLAVAAGCSSGALAQQGNADALSTVVDSSAIDASTLDATPAAADASAPDLAGSDAMVGVPCNNLFCDTSNGNVCCEGFPPTCSATPCPVGIQSDACDGPEDCPGRFCCLLVAPLFGTECVTSCGQTGDQRGLICHTDADCPPNQACLQLEVSGGLSGCFPR